MNKYLIVYDIETNNWIKDITQIPYESIEIFGIGIIGSSFVFAGSRKGLIHDTQQGIYQLYTKN